MNDKNLFDLDSVLKQANLVKEIVSTSSMEQKNQALKAAAWRRQQRKIYWTVLWIV